MPRWQLRDVSIGWKDAPLTPSDEGKAAAPTDTNKEQKINNNVARLILPPRAGHTLTVLNHGRTLVMYGGVETMIHAELASELGIHHHPSRAANESNSMQSSGSSPNLVAHGRSGSGGGSSMAGPFASSDPPLPASSLIRPDVFLIDRETGRVQIWNTRDELHSKVKSSRSSEAKHKSSNSPLSSSHLDPLLRVGHASVALDHHTLLVNGGWNGRKMMASSVLVDLRRRMVMLEANNTKLQSGSSPPISSHTSSSSALLPPVPILHGSRDRLLPAARRDHVVIRVPPLNTHMEMEDDLAGDGDDHERHHQSRLLGSSPGALYAIGGWDGGECRADVWTCKLTPVKQPANGSNHAHQHPHSHRHHPDREWQWSPFKTHGPAPCARRGAMSVAIGSKIFMFGGMEGSTRYCPCDKIHVLDTSNGVWEVMDARDGGCINDDESTAASVSESYTNARPAQPSPDINIDQSKTGIPSPRAWSSVAWIASTYCILLFGGVGSGSGSESGSTFYNDLYIFDVRGHGRWTKIHDGSNGRTDHSTSDGKAAATTSLTSPPPPISSRTWPSPRACAASCVTVTDSGSGLSLTMWLHGGYTYSPVVHRSHAAIMSESIVIQPCHQLWSLQIDMAEVAYMSDTERTQLEVICSNDNNEEDDEDE